MPAKRSSPQTSLFPEEHDFSLAQLADGAPTVFTIGHSNRKIEDFVAALKTFGIERLADIRNFPRSRFNPQFNQTSLMESLRKAVIEYHWVQKLGGYREGGYVPYMDTPDFVTGMARLEAMAREKRTACMCSELKWTQCHRRHVAEALSERGWRVVHIMDASRAETHRIEKETA